MKKRSRRTNITEQEEELICYIYLHTSYSVQFIAHLFDIGRENVHRKLDHRGLSNRVDNRHTYKNKVYTDKYKSLIEEPMNVGKNYREYLAEYNLKVPRSFWGKL